jgi:hypothetical protein
MASAPELSVSIEAALHKALTKALQEVEQDHGVRVTDLSARWTAAGSLANPRSFLTGLRITTESGQ